MPLLPFVTGVQARQRTLLHRTSPLNPAPDEQPRRRATKPIPRRPPCGCHRAANHTLGSSTPDRPRRQTLDPRRFPPRHNPWPCHPPDRRIPPAASHAVATAPASIAIPRRAPRRAPCALPSEHQRPPACPLGRSLPAPRNPATPASPVTTPAAPAANDKPKSSGRNPRCPS